MKSLEEYCLENKKENLLDEWDYEENAPLTPKNVGYGSIKKVAWKCKKGHQWNAIISNRTRWSNCPYCAGKLASDDNCLEALSPLIAKEWDYEKNGLLTPKKVTTGTTQKAWWICAKGHSYHAVISNRSKGSKCPYCSGKIARRVLNVDTGEVYDNIKDAASKIGCSKSGIISSCDSGKTIK